MEPRGKIVVMIPISDEYFLAFARDLATRAGRMALEKFRRSSGWLKDNESLVTEVDLDVQKLIERSIREKFPDHAFLGEEMGLDARPGGLDEWLWVVDPIDGTESFASGLPVWGVSIALFHRGQPRVGVFYMPVTGELYHATAGQEAMLTLLPRTASEDDRFIHVNPDPEFHTRALFLVSSDFHRIWKSDFPGKQRTLGSIAAHQCIIARGAGLAAIMRPRLWDIAASALILMQAGGEIVEFETGRPVTFSDYFDGSRLPWIVAVAGRTVYDQLKPLVASR